MSASAVVVTHTAPGVKVGDVVHFVLPQECMRGGSCRPAIVLEGGVDVVKLFVFAEGEAQPRNLGFDPTPVVNHNASGRHGTWHLRDCCPHGA